MVIYFNEEDLLSFGAYMISKERRKYVESTYDYSKATMSLDERLGRVYEDDIYHWSNLVNQANGINQ